MQTLHHSDRIINEKNFSKRVFASIYGVPPRDTERRRERVILATLARPKRRVAMKSEKERQTS